MEMETRNTILKRMHTREFKEAAVQQFYEHPTRNLSVVATNLDLNNNVLRRWIKEKESGHWDRKTWKKNTATQLATKTPPRAATAPAPAAAAAHNNVTDAFNKMRQTLDNLTTERDLLKSLLAHYMRG